MLHVPRILAVIALPLLLAACIFQPGKFTASLDINADRSFVFSYLGEIHAVDMEKLQGSDMPMTEADGDAKKPTSEPADGKAKGMSEADKAALAETLAKEAGFRKVEYRGDDIWFVDYRIAGTLTHSFVFPYNQDAGIIFPFIAIEPRGNGTVRMKAPAFARTSGQPGMAGMPVGDISNNSRIEGDFTLSTDAEIISQSNEDGAQTGTDGRKTIRWKITPQTDIAPMAVLRMKN